MFSKFGPVVKVSQQVAILKWSSSSSGRRFCSKIVPIVSKKNSKLVDKSPEKSKYQVAQNDTIDWTAEMGKIIEDEQKHSILDPVQNESDVLKEPALLPSFNLAAYVQKSSVLQQLISLGVNLYKLERQGHGQYIMRLDFDRDVRPYILFLSKDVGIDSDLLGQFFTKNPKILNENLDDLQVRINYLEAKKFTKDDIVRIVETDPSWLLFTTKEIDERLGFFQKEFQLMGDQVRQLTVTQPRLITTNLDRVREITFSVREEFGLDKSQTRELLLKEPRIWLTPKWNLMERYDFLIQQMKLTNEQIITCPSILRAKLHRIEERHKFLKHLKRVQYDPTKELYVSLDGIAKCSDEEFVDKCARSNMEEFDRFLRTM